MSHQNQVMHILAFNCPDNSLNALLCQHSGSVTTRIGAMRGQIHGVNLIDFGAGGKPRRMLDWSRQVTPNSTPAPGTLPGSVHQEIIRQILHLEDNYSINSGSHRVGERPGSYLRVCLKFLDFQAQVV